jgi:hypothetical protein
MDWLFAAVSLSIAIIVLGALAHDFGRRWLEDRAATRAPLVVLAELERKIEEGILARKAMAEDWKRKFTQLEADWKKLKEHADAQYSGAIAQITSTSRNWRNP